MFGLCCLSANAQEAAKYKVESPSVARRDRPVRVNHPAGAKIQAIYANVVAGTVTWVYLPEEHFDRGETHTVFAAPPGDYLLTSGDSTILKIVQGGDSIPEPPPPKPEPKPEPKPDPKPAPKLKPDWVVWVYEQADAINQIPQTNTRLSIETRRYLESRGIKMIAYDADQPAAKPFMAVAKQLPAVIVSQDANNYQAFSAPKTLDELKSILKEATGE
jgi:hypothetical protein